MYEMWYLTHAKGGGATGEAAVRSYGQLKWAHTNRGRPLEIPYTPTDETKARMKLEWMRIPSATIGPVLLEGVIAVSRWAFQSC